MRFTILSLALFSTLSFAGEYEDCLATAAPSSYAHNTGCLAEESARLDKKVQALFTQKLNDLDQDDELPMERKKLARKFFIQAQKSWHDYMDATCRYTYETMNGSGAPAALAQCHVDLITQRMADLEKW